MIFPIIGVALGVVALRARARRKAAELDMARRIQGRTPVFQRPAEYDAPETLAWHEEQERLNRIDPNFNAR